MEAKRAVKFSTLFVLLKSKRPFFVLGLVFTCVSIFVLIPFIYFLSTALTDSYENYDGKIIKEKGTVQMAKIVRITPFQNETINGEHPDIINYKYENNGAVYFDKFKTLELDKTADLNIGDSIAITVFNKESVINNLKPFKFPIAFFCILPGIFFLVGIPFLLIGLLPALNKFNLYKYGIVKNASIVSMTVKTKRYKFKVWQAVLVVYSFSNANGAKVLGSSLIEDDTILIDKNVGDPIKIMVAENNENKSTIIQNNVVLKNNWDLNYL